MPLAADRLAVPARRVAARPSLAPRRRSRSMYGPSSASAAIARPASSPTRRSTASPTSTCWTNASRRPRKGWPSASAPCPAARDSIATQLIGGGTRHAEGIAVSQKCDLVIAVIAGNLVDERERTAAYRHLEFEHGAGLDQPTARRALSVIAGSAPLRGALSCSSGTAGFAAGLMIYRSRPEVRAVRKTTTRRSELATLPTQ